MFKDYKKYLSASLKVYLFVLVCVLIMKIVGLDYFGLDMSNSTIKNIDSFLNKYYLLNIWYLISYYIYTMVIIDISLNRKINKLVCLFISCISLLNLIFIKPHMNSLQITIFDFAYLYIIILILNKFNNKWKMFKRYICLVILNIMFQAVSLFVRNVGSNEIYIENSILWLLINLDYIILSIISYKIYFMKGDNEKWVVHISSSLKKISLKKLLKQLQEKLVQTTEKSIEKILKEGITTNNLEYLYKLVDIYKDAKEVENMNNYGNYGRGPGYDSYGRGNYGEYGNYGNYGEYGRDSYSRRGYDMKYRGDDEMDRMRGEYGRYMESRNRYGAGEETDKSFHYMVKALEDFIKVLHEEADTPQQKQMLNETLQKSMR